MSGFTAQEALDDRGTEDAEMIGWDTVKRICADHGASVADFNTETFSGDYPMLVDAGDLLAWLGY